VEVVSVQARTPHLVRVRLGGEALDGFDPPRPAASVRLLLPRPGAGLVMPTWNGNEFLDPDGRRPLLRTLTPLRFDPGLLTLDVEVVLHGEAPLSSWATSVAPGDPVAVSGPGRGWEPGPDGAAGCGAPAFLLAGDESAVPAIGTLLAALPAQAEVDVRIEVRSPDAVVGLPEHPGARVDWLVAEPGAAPGDAMVAAVAGAGPVEGARVWVAGEAAAVQRIRIHLADRGVPRSRASVRGYWKHGRAEGASA
jgi:NADPH-dependent ferric siderophore reductase